jgi:hypothetical protein
MKSSLALLLFSLFLGCSSSHIALQTTLPEREKFKRELVTNTIEAAVSQRLAKENESKLEGAFWGMGLVRYTSANTTRAIRDAFGQWNSLSPSMQRAMLEVVYTMYADEFLSEADDVIKSTKSEKLFAMGALHLLRGTNWSEIGRVTEQMHRRFPNHASHPILRMLGYDLQLPLLDQPPFTPPIRDLLSAPIEKGKPAIFSLQRKNRKFSGLAIVRDANGKFVRLNDSTVFSISQLALASSNLPGYLSNGNTPQGIFSVQGFGRSKNAFIGPTKNVQMVLPFEAKPYEFFHTSNKSDTVWTKERYDNLLPQSWKNYLPIHTAYYAGEAGRWDIIAHGTTIDPEFYSGEPYFPNAPTLGCLSAVESWSLETGERVSSEQQKLIDIMKQIGFTKGYVVVVEIDGPESAVTPEEVSLLLRSADGK